MVLNNLKPFPGATKKKKRLGSGGGSGKGKTCGRGHKGQKARSGGGVRPGFEGGQMELVRRVPKRGFTNKSKIYYQLINLAQLEERFSEGDALTLELLRETFGLKEKSPIKILGNGKLSKKFVVVEAHKFSKSAQEVFKKTKTPIKEILC